METVRPRQYRVTAEDFPITIEVTAVDLPDNLAIIGSVREVVDGILVRKTTPSVTTPSALVRRYQIGAPSQLPCDITHHVDGWFPSDAPDSARYAVVITSDTGDSARATLRVPTLNPNVANFAFSVTM